MRQAKELAFPQSLPSERRMDLLLFFHGVFYAQRAKHPIFLRGSPGVALVGLGKTDLGAARGHSDLHKARHGTAVEGVDPAIGDCDGGVSADAHRGRKERTRGRKERTRGPKAPHERGICKASPHG